LGGVAVESDPGGARAAQSTMLEVEFAQLSDNGRTRDHNEDYIGYVSPATPEEARTHGWLFALADGVGGHAHGEVASREAGNACWRVFARLRLGKRRWLC
jgi:serine/threonine protein phosphatase PrpC